MNSHPEAIFEFYFKRNRVSGFVKQDIKNLGPKFVYVDEKNVGNLREVYHILLVTFHHVCYTPICLRGFWSFNPGSIFGYDGHFILIPSASISVEEDFKALV